jgi:hypothetical protein
MDMLIPVFVALGVAALAALVVTSVRAERRRRERIRQWAARNGWTVTERPAVDWGTRLPGGNRRGVSLLVSGVVSGWPVGVAEYSYQTTSSDSDGSSSTTTHRYTVTVVRLAVSYPPLAVVSRGALSRLGRAVFGDKAAATGHDAFDRQFRVQARDPALARTLLGPALIAEHLAGRVPAWSLAGRDLLTWRSGWIKEPDQIATLAAPLVRVAELLGR